MYYLGVNFGRTVITVGVVDENGEIIIKGSVPTLKYRGIEDIVKDIATLCIRVVNNAKLNIDKDIVSIGIAITGIPDKKDGTIVYSSYFDYHTVQVKSILKQYINLPIYIENDANCYGLAESRWGAAKGFKNSVTVNIGQGVGAGIIVDGKIYNGAFSGAGELGHHVIVVDGEPCHCGRRGCWECYASEDALIRDAKILSIKYPKSEIFKMVNGDFRVMSYNTPFEAAKMGDKYAVELINKYIKYMAVGVINIANILQPDVIVIGGKVMEQGEYFLDSLKNEVEKHHYGDHLSNTLRAPEIKLSQLGYDAIIMGAAMLRE